MGKLGWILGLTCLGVAGYLLFSDTTNGQFRSADDVDEFGDRISNWGTKSRVKGTGGELGGKLEQGFGKLTGDKDTQAQGVVDEAVGSVKDAAGKAAHAVSDTVSNLNS